MAELNEVRDIGRVAERPRPSLWSFLKAWLLLGMQSFGGGTATLFLIRRAVVEQRRWLTPEEFTRDWSLCFVAPGINLLCLTILVGWRVAGIAGSLTALVGLLFPSVGITIIMIAFYADIQHLPIVQSALHGIVPATVGLGLMMTISTARPLIVASRREGRTSLMISLTLVAVSAAATAFWNVPVILTLVGGGLIGAFTMWRRLARQTRRP